MLLLECSLLKTRLLQFISVSCCRVSETKMLAEILTDAFTFLSTPDLAALLVSSRSLSSTTLDTISRRTLHTVRISIGRNNNQVIVDCCFRKASGATTFESTIINSTDDVEETLRSVLGSRIVELFVLRCAVLEPVADRFLRATNVGGLEAPQNSGWFAYELGRVLRSVVVLHTLRLHTSVLAPLDSAYDVVRRLHYVKVSFKFGH